MPRPSPRTNRTRRVPHPVLIGHAASLRRVLRRCGELSGLAAMLSLCAEQAAAPDDQGTARVLPHRDPILLSLHHLVCSSILLSLHHLVCSSILLSLHHLVCSSILLSLHHLVCSSILLSLHHLVCSSCDLVTCGCARLSLGAGAGHRSRRARRRARRGGAGGGAARRADAHGGRGVGPQADLDAQAATHGPRPPRATLARRPLRFTKCGAASIRVSCREDMFVDNDQEKGGNGARKAGLV
jgi:hypothetical protein